MAHAQKASLLGSQLTESSVMSSSSLSQFPQSRCNSLASWTPVLLRLLLDLDTYGGVDPLGVSSISKDGCGYYGSKIKYNFSWANPAGSFPECCRSANVTAIP